MKYPISLVMMLLLFIDLLWGQQSLSREVTIPTEDPGVTLAGTINLPAGTGRHPAALLIWGNGPHTRDLEISGSPVFRQLADHLLSLGMVVLRVDKRGFGQSAGPQTDSEGAYTTRDLAADMKAAYTFLNQQKQVDTSRVGLIGHSEGAMIAYMLASEENGVDWVAVFSPPAVPGDSLVAAQKRWNRRQLGMSPAVAWAVEQAWDNYAQFIKNGYTDDSTYYALGRAFLLAHGLEKDDERITESFIDQLIDGYKTPWYQFFFRTDPADYLSRLQCPLLAVFAGEDEQVTVEQNLPPMHAALRRAGHTRYQILVLPDEDHFFLRYEDQRRQKHQFGEMQLSGRLLTSLTAWLQTAHILP